MSHARICAPQSDMDWRQRKLHDSEVRGIGKVKLDSADKPDTDSFAYPPLVGGSRTARTNPKRKRGQANAVSKELGENRFKQLVKKIGQDKAMEMLKGAETGFKENYALLKKLSEM